MMDERCMTMYIYKVDHYKVLGLPSGENGRKLTQKVISEAFKAQVLPWFCNHLGLPSHLTEEELTEAIRTMDLEYLNPDNRRRKDGDPDPDPEAIKFPMLILSYNVLNDPQERHTFDAWMFFVNWFEKLKMINCEEQKAKRDEYDLMSDDDFFLIIDKVRKSYPWVMGLPIIFLPVGIAASVGRIIYKFCGWVGSSSCGVIKSAVLKRSRTGSSTDGKKVGACSSGCDDIHDWELVNEDEWC